MSYIINSLVLYQPCDAKTYTSSKTNGPSLGPHSYTDTLSNVPTTRKKQHSRQGMRNCSKKRGPSITRGLVSTINTIRRKRRARTIGKRKHATILRTLQP